MIKQSLTKCGSYNTPRLNKTADGSDLLNKESMSVNLKELGFIDDEILTIPGQRPCLNTNNENRNKEVCSFLETVLFSFMGNTKSGGHYILSGSHMFRHHLINMFGQKAISLAESSLEIKEDFRLTSGNTEANAFSNEKDYDLVIDSVSSGADLLSKLFKKVLNAESSRDIFITLSNKVDLAFIVNTPHQSNEKENKNIMLISGSVETISVIYRSDILFKVDIVSAHHEPVSSGMDMSRFYQANIKCSDLYQCKFSLFDGSVSMCTFEQAIADINFIISKKECHSSDRDKFQCRRDLLLHLMLEHRDQFTLNGMKLASDKSQYLMQYSYHHLDQMNGGASMAMIADNKQTIRLFKSVRTVAIQTEDVVRVTQGNNIDVKKAMVEQSSQTDPQKMEPIIRENAEINNDSNSFPVTNEERQMNKNRSEEPLLSTCADENINSLVTSAEALSDFLGQQVIRHFQNHPDEIKRAYYNEDQHDKPIGYEYVIDSNVLSGVICQSLENYLPVLSDRELTHLDDENHTSASIEQCNPKILHSNSWLVEQEFVSSIKAHSIEEYSSETFKRFLNYLSKNDINNACQQVNKNNLLKPVEDELRLPPLFYLINKNYIKYISYIKKLIDNGVDLNGWIRLKIKNGLVIKVTALGYAVFSAGELKSINALKTRGNIIKNLIKAGSDPEMSIITEKEAIEDKVNNVLSIEEPLAHAIDKKYRQIINVLLLQKVSPDAQGKTERTLFTALTRAVAVYSETKQREDLDTITRLIEAKVNLNQETIIIESGGFTTDRALGRAIQDKNIEVIGLLLTAGCDPNLTRHIKFQKRHPVFDILDTMDPDFLTVFLSHGNKVDLNVKYTGKSKYKDGKSMRVLPVLHYIVFLHFNRIKNIVNEMDSLAVRQERVTGTEEQTTKIIALLKDVNFAALSDSPEITAETWYRETIPEFREYKLTFSDDLFSPPALPDSALE